MKPIVIIFAVSIVFLLIRYFLLQIWLKKYDIITDEEIDTDFVTPQVATFKGVGVLFRGRFRKQIDRYVSYQFFCWFLPLFPTSCYLVSDGSEPDEYLIYGKVKMRFVEIIAVYLQNWGWGGIVFTIFCSIIYLTNFLH